MYLSVCMCEFFFILFVYSMYVNKINSMHTDRFKGRQGSQPGREGADCMLTGLIFFSVGWEIVGT